MRDARGSRLVLLCYTQTDCCCAMQSHKYNKTGTGNRSSSAHSQSIRKKKFTKQNKKKPNQKKHVRRKTRATTTRKWLNAWDKTADHTIPTVRATCTLKQRQHIGSAAMTSQPTKRIKTGAHARARETYREMATTTTILYNTHTLCKCLQLVLLQFICLSEPIFS